MFFCFDFTVSRELLGKKRFLISWEYPFIAEFSPGIVLDSCGRSEELDEVDAHGAHDDHDDHKVQYEPTGAARKDRYLGEHIRTKYFITPNVTFTNVYVSP